MLLETTVADRGIDLVGAQDFYRHAHQKLFGSMARVREEGQAVDFVTMCHDLERHGELDAVGGRAYVASLVDGMPRGANIVNYADIIKETKRRRDLIRYGTRVTTEAYGGESDSHALTEKADEWLRELAGTQPLEVVEHPAAVTDFLRQFHDRIDRSQELLGLSTGFPSLDDLTCGLVPGEMTVVAAAVRAGKTAFSLNLTMTACRRQQCVLFVSLEMTKEQLLTRVASACAGVELLKVRKGLVTLPERQRITRAMEETKPWPLVIDDTPRMTIFDIRARARRLAAERPLALIVVDYIQLITGEQQRGREHNRALEVGDFARGLKMLARELSVPVIGLSQITRDVRKQNRRPDLHDLSESGGLEKHADNVWFIHEAEKTELIIKKQRQGPEGSVDLFFDKAVGVFHDSAADATAEDAIRHSQTALPDW